MTKSAKDILWWMAIAMLAMIAIMEAVKEIQHGIP